MTLRIGDGDVLMAARAGGWFETTVGKPPAGSEYGFVLSNGDRVPDPASRRQSDVLGPSRLVDPAGYAWRHAGWKGRRWEEAVVYEIHPGTFTPEGTFQAAKDRLGDLADLGFTAVEIMPLAQFPGRRGWGYDGVFHYAPFAPYGSADDFKAFVDEAHGRGLMVFLDVVYNHFGPEGNFLARYAPAFFRQDDPTPWGPRIDVSHEPVRRFFIENAIYWLAEYRLDGLRFDAINQIEDESEVHFLEQLSREAYQSVAGRQVHLITENSANGTDLMADLGGGKRLYKADWNDDFHHALHAAVTGENTGHYRPFSDHAWQYAGRALAQGYIEQGECVLGVEPPPPASLPTTCYVHFLQNHDQVGNRAAGDRLHRSLDPALYAALVELLALSPQIPLFFQGDDHLSTRPFRFFADYEGQLRTDIWKSREVEALNFGGFPQGFDPGDLPDPSDPRTFEECRLDWSEAERPEAKGWRSFLRRLLTARQRRIVPLLGPSTRGGRLYRAPERCLFVDWQTPGGILKLRANLSAGRVEIETEPGVEIYPGGAAGAEGALCAYGVRVFLASAVP